MKGMTIAAIVGALAVIGCAAKKPDHFGTGVNFPTFNGPIDFVKSANRVLGVAWFKRLDGKKVDMEWITPKFREKICLVVTINNHCGGG